MTKPNNQPPKMRNACAQYQDYKEHLRAFKLDARRGVCAVNDKLEKIPLKNLEPDQVEFVAGFWRVQIPNNYNIRLVRDKMMIIHEKLDHTESTDFNFYRASEFTWNCYQILPGQSYVAAELFGEWGYGRNIEDARAFLGIKFYTKHQKLIHSIENRRTKKQNMK